MKGDYKRYYKDPDYHKKRYTEKKNLVLRHYGDKCVCCGEKNPLFLTIDHKNNDGYLLGRGRNMVAYAVQKGFPDDLQLLCYNCNCGKNNRFRKGTCPHQFS